MNPITSFPLFLPGLHADKNNNINIVAGNVGSFTTQLALYKSENQNVVRQSFEVYDNKQFNSFTEIYNNFVEKTQLSKPDRIALGVGGPVIGSTCRIDQLSWELEAEKIKSEIGVDDFYMINDLEATAYSLHKVGSDNLQVVYEGNQNQKGNVAILAPGNGLGESGLYWDGEAHRPFATEGGHSEFAPRNDQEVDFYQFLKKIYGIVSWETVLSKNGMFNIYRFLRDVGRHEGCPKVNNRQLDDLFIDQLKACAFDNEYDICRLTLEYFIEFMAREANSLVLKLKATGGLVLTGEIPLKIRELLDEQKFYKNFVVSDKMERLLKDVPIYILKDEDSVIRGAAIYGAYYGV